MNDDDSEEDDQETLFDDNAWRPVVYDDFDNYRKSDYLNIIT